MIEDTLAQLGFTGKEIQIYLTILQYGKMTPVGIARMTKINRTTVYTVTKELVKKGLLAEDLGGSLQTYIARTPSNLEQLIRREEEILENKKRITARAIEELSAFSQKVKHPIPKVTFIEEEGIEDHLYRQTPLWNASMKDCDAEYWGFQDASFIQFYEKWIDWYWLQKSSKNISLKLISNKQAENIKKKKFDRRQIKFWDKTQEFTATTWVMGDYTAMIITNQNPKYLVEIYDQTLAHNMREVFKGIWNEIK